MDATVAEGMQLLRAGVDALLSCRLELVPSTEVTELLSSLEVERRRLECVDQRVVAEASDRCLAGDYARTSTADLLCSLLRLAPREARARVERARDLGPRRRLTGEPLEPIFALAAAAARDGSISAAHIEVITRCVEQVPSEIAHGAASVVERLLVDAALHCGPALVASTGRELLARIDQDGVAPRDRDHARLRRFTVHEHHDGSGRVGGTLTPEAMAVWRAIIGALSAPSPGTDGVPDDRTADQRRHDGFLDAGRRLLRSATLPTSGGRRSPSW